MELKSLMSGIAVVIDNALQNAVTDEDSKDEDRDLIVKIVERISQEWSLPFYMTNKMPPEEIWPNLLQAASFILLDWKLWKTGADELEKAGVKENIQFLDQAKDYFVPVFIVTNESPEDIKDELPPNINREGAPVFIQAKSSLLSMDSLDFRAIEDWIRKNASVYAMKTWEQVFHAAKKELFSSMYEKSPDWPRVFWKAYQDDTVDPSSSLTHLINDSLQGRMRTNAFEEEILTGPHAEVPREDLLALIGETSFQGTLSGHEIRCGDLFQSSEKRFLLNLRPDCDCVPRSGQVIDAVRLYCVEGKEMRDDELRDQYRNGHFDERVWESVAFAACNGKSVRFNFKKLRVKRFVEIKDKRIGRLLHPYLTRVQQRYALYLQRQGLPRIPEGAIPSKPDTEISTDDDG